MALYRCNICKEFDVPADHIGAALMTEHLREKHAEDWRNRRLVRGATGSGGQGDG